MKSMVRRALALARLAAGWAVMLGVVSVVADEPPLTGPGTEKRFPPLRVPPGFQATLFACDPLVEYPSAVALGPRPGSVFVAVDYLTGLGTEIVRGDEIRLVEDTDGDGYADRAPVYAGQFHSIQGLACHEGVVYAMHAPLLTSLRDTDGDGAADERRDLLTGLGLSPENNPTRLHCANGVVVGHDGWLYLALGDNGCDVPRPEGDRLVLQGGGILRCRPDGRDLHLFASGLRNIYDVALDEELNVFVRDNENDGGNYKIRVYHSFFGADHGYPYLYDERPAEALPPLADLGLGSSAGGLCYLEAAFPPEYQGNLFFCEWGRSVVRYRPERAGSTFGPLAEAALAAGADDDPYGFKPTDLVVQRDGSLVVADWADGQRPKRGRGRVYRIAPVQPAKPRAPPDAAAAGLEGWIARLASASYLDRIDAQTAIEHRGSRGLAAVRDAWRQGRLDVRGRFHALWIMARVGGPDAADQILDLARTEPDPRVQAQAVRAVADLADPVLVRHRLAAGPGDAELASRLADFAGGRDARVVLEVAVAVGRLRWPQAPTWLRSIALEPDAALEHAAIQTLRRSENWPALLELLDEPIGEPIRALALAAIADRFEPAIVDGLIGRLEAERDPSRRREYADALTRVAKKPGPWVYWGYRPLPRPPHTVAWEPTEAIEQALDRALADPDHSVRLAVLGRMQREKIATRLATLEAWLGAQRDPHGVRAILESLGEHPAALVREVLAEVVADREHTAANRLRALELVAAGLDDASAGRLLELAEATEDGPVLAEVLRHTGRRPELKAAPLVAGKLSSPDPAVRTAAVEALAELEAPEAAELLPKLFDDQDVSVRRAAVSSAGKLRLRAAIDPLLRLATDADPATRRASLEALRLLGEPRAVPLAVAGLADGEIQATALACVADLGGPDQAPSVVETAIRSPSAEVLPLAIGMLTTWSGRPGLSPAERQQLDDAVARVQGASGMLVRWHAAGPLAREAAAPLVERLALAGRPLVQPAGGSGWQTVLAKGTDSRVDLDAGKRMPGETAWLAVTDVRVPEPTDVELLGSADGTLRIWLNGRRVYERPGARAFQTDSDRFDAVLAEGSNRLVAEVSFPEQAAPFHLRFRRKSSSAERERFVQAALARSGDAGRGRQIFLDGEKSLCAKCHRIGDLGERVGPDLTGLGSRFSRIYIIESILEPSRAIAPSYETVMLVLDNGQVLTGVRTAQSDTALTLVDHQGQKHVVPKAAIEVEQSHAMSTMPDGLEKRLTPDEFIDLVAFLVSLHDGAPP